MNLHSLLKELEKSQWEKRSLPRLKGPILTRYDLQKKSFPRGDFVVRTSGSTGIPVVVQKTHLSQLWWNATNLREVVWHKRDLSQSFAVIRATIFHEISQPDWGPAFALLGKTGPLYGHPLRGDHNSWLQNMQPGYLFTYPSIVEGIDLGSIPSLKGIKTTGETLLQRNKLIQDMYSCEEAGTIALQCPDNPEVYHVMENILVEVLDEKNEPCDEGKVVITDLTSSYLHRYDIGDYAECASCFCGRGLQTIKNIKGRRRNKVVFPDGSKHWPMIGSLEYRNIAPIQRFQIAQVDTEVLEFRLMIEKPLTDLQQRALRETVQKFIGYPFEIYFVYLDEFPVGKFEEFINLIATS